MSFRFLRLATVYEEFVDSILREHADFSQRTHAQMHALLANGQCGAADNHARHLRRLGYEATTHFISVKPLQERWAQEQQAIFNEANWFDEIAIEQVRQFQPDVLFLDDLFSMPPSFRKKLLSACKRRPLLVGWRSAATTDFTQFADLDLILTSTEAIAQKFRQQNIDVEVLQHSFEPSVSEQFSDSMERDIPISFAGSMGRNHPGRFKLVEQMLMRTPLQLWGADRSLGWKNYGRYLAQNCGLSTSLSARAKTLPLRYPGRVHPRVHGLKYFEILRRSQIVVNCHEDNAAGDYAANIRLFEAPGMGACLLTDEKRNLPELFEVGTEVVTFSSNDDCVEQALQLLKQPKRCQEIGEAGRKRVLQDHTFGQRMEELADIIECRLNRRANATFTVARPGFEPETSR